MTGPRVEQMIVDADEAGMRVDRWFKAHYPGLGFGALQKLLRSGQIRIDGGRVKTDARLNAGQSIRVPPLATGERSKRAGLTPKMMQGQQDGDLLSKMLIFENEHVFVFNKPSGLAVQGGSGINRHVDDMLEAWRNKKGEKPRLVHRLDRDTSGVLVVARSRSAAKHLAEAFRRRTTSKTYWALVKGTPHKLSGRISNYLLKEKTEDGDRMRVVAHGTKDADHAISSYRVIETAARRLAWLEMQPETGRTHQLRVHAAELDCPIIGDPKYFEADQNWDFPGGLQNRLHLHARRIAIPMTGGQKIDVRAELPPHMVQAWNLLGFDLAAAVDEEEGR